MITDIIPRKNVRISITRLNPSSARCRLMPNAGIQSSLRSINQSLFEGSDCRTYNIIRIRSIDNAESDIIRGQTGFRFPVIHAKKAPANNITIR